MVYRRWRHLCTSITMRQATGLCTEKKSDSIMTIYLAFQALSLNICVPTIQYITPLKDMAAIYLTLSLQRRYHSSSIFPCTSLKQTSRIPQCIFWMVHNRCARMARKVVVEKPSHRSANERRLYPPLNSAQHTSRIRERLSKKPCPISVSTFEAEGRSLMWCTLLSVLPEIFFTMFLRKALSSDDGRRRQPWIWVCFYLQ